MRRVIWGQLMVGLLAFGGVHVSVSYTHADTFGSGVNSFEIDFVKIGAPGNLPDENPNPAGAVGYEYRIGKYEVSEHMVEKANALGGLGITIDDRGPDYPATSVTWYEAAQFVNWLNEDSGHPVAYKFDDMGEFQLWEEEDPGYDAANLYRNSLAFYFLPSLDEWHKAAYYDPVAGHYWDYATGSDAIPDGIDFLGDPDFDAVFFDGAANSDPNEITNVGLSSPFGTFGQGGNVREWLETAFDTDSDDANEHRFARGGSKNDTFTAMMASASGIGTAPGLNSPIHGFRVASVIPEPSTLIFVGVALLGALRLRWRARHR